ncbi:Maf-like protein, putative [Plasmodium malariae]|uniref:Maf-like protein, putative n=1 Tax=Plasmodium malariae TaxID=5858 RepID=A0A1D3JM26_PLAMA|nr:Maf-like protein, putative [Plasmodium malariae]SBT87718.1 Maf-like protein, putative [Plasmodium malariae]
MSNANLEPQLSNISGKKNLENNSGYSNEEVKLKIPEQSFNDFELGIDEDIIEYLSTRICNKNLQHKILKINNLIDDYIYNYIVNSEEGEEINAHVNNATHADTENKYVYSNNISNSHVNMDGNKKSGSSSENVDDLNSKKDKSKNCNSSKQQDDFHKIKMMNFLGENNIVYNSKAKQNNVLFLCYDKKNEECNTCDRYRKNYMSNMKPTDNTNPSNECKINGTNEISILNTLNDYFFVLGSTSNSRKYILKKSNLDFLSIRTRINEKKIGCRKRHDPFTLTSNISVAKGIKLLNTIKRNKELKLQIEQISKNKKVILLVGDEVIYCNNKIYEKPKNEMEAYNFLKSYNNNVIYSYSSITLIELKTEKFITGIDESIINIYNMDDDIISKIMMDSSIYYCAGALKIENTHMRKHIKVIKGNIDSIFGLSLNLLSHLVNFL